MTGKKIVVVDDDMDFRMQMELQLKAAGYEVATADGVATAREVFEREKPDLAIVDLMMEEPDGGFKLSYFIKREYNGIPVILVSAVTAETGLQFDAASSEERSWIQADAFLAKPVRFEQVQREITRLLGE